MDFLKPQKISESWHQASAAADITTHEIDATHHLMREWGLRESHAEGTDPESDQASVSTC